ncbi:DUF6371 domain-containing protein [Winogradskyella sp.]|nr:DUF6371 domain-containing protein [Winogradskyella sp.]
MIQYKYSLDKSSNKFICPSCGQKTFVRYVDNASNNYLDDEYGRCDRENKCRAHFKPNGNRTIDLSLVLKPQKMPSYHSFELVEKSILDQRQNNFIEFLENKFPEYALEAIKKYLIGTSRKFANSTIFWQIDHNEEVHAGKIMLYDNQTGKRCKSANGKSFISWVHKIKPEKNFNLVQCLFGLHLIADTDQKTIALVESEKTAVIMSIFKPEYIWLATGSKHGFKEKMLEPIRDFRIVAFPDKGEYYDWKKTARELNSKGYNIVVDEMVDNNDYVEGTDLADIYFSNMGGGN